MGCFYNGIDKYTVQNIKKTKNNQSYTKSIWWIPNSKIKLTKTSNYTNIYVYKFKKNYKSILQIKKNKGILNEKYKYLL